VFDQPIYSRPQTKQELHRDEQEGHITDTPNAKGRKMNKDFEGFVSQQEKYLPEGYDPKQRASAIIGGNYQPKHE
jgi:hypothetical protein